jgi:hypothetical protein
MNTKYTKKYSFTFTEFYAEWLGTVLGASFSLSIACFVLYAIHKPNDAMLSWMYLCWACFVIQFIWMFLSEILAAVLVIIGSEAFAYIGHIDWWGYLIAPIVAVVGGFFALFVGAFIGVVLCLIYKTFFDGNNKASISDYSHAIAIQLGFALGDFADSEKLMPQWMLSILARFLSIGFLVCAFGPHPPQYFHALRWILYFTCIYSFLLALWQVVRHQAMSGYGRWAVTFLVTAIVFNPIWIVSFPRHMWIVLDWAIAALLFVSVFLCPRTFGDACLNWWRKWQTDGLYILVQKNKRMEEELESLDQVHAVSEDTRMSDKNVGNIINEPLDNLKAELDFMAQQPRALDPFAKLMKSAQMGHSGAQYYVARRYDSTVGDMDESVVKDDTKAAIWYRRAALQGFVFAQNRLGDLYKLGRGIEQNYELAASWYQKAATQWDAEAFNNLGLLYANGHGVPLDLVQAIKYLSLAKLGRRKDLGSALTSIENTATPEQIIEGHRLAEECTARIHRNQIALDCGVAVDILSLYIQESYLGLLEGSPNEMINQRITKQFCERVNNIWGGSNSHIIKPALTIKYAEPYLPRYAVAVWLREREGSFKQLVVIFFADLDEDQEFHIAIKDHVKSIDWELLAMEWEP